jgi:hypothetical protein
VAVWAQIHSIPELYRESGIVDQLARRIGQVKSVEMNHQRFFEGDYVRVRAIIKVNEPLIRFAPLNLGGSKRMLLNVKYEKIGYFCAVCGVMGHDMEECGDGVHPPEKVQWGKWLFAQRRSPAGTMFTPRGGMAGRFGEEVGEEEVILWHGSARLMRCMRRRVNFLTQHRARPSRMVRQWKRMVILIRRKEMQHVY